MTDYLLALFIGNEYKEYPLSSIHSSSFSHDVEPYVQNSPIDYSQLFIEKNNRWYMNSTVHKQITVTYNREEIKEKAIEHGDFYLLYDQANEIRFECLITSLDKEKIHFAKYKLPKNKNLFIGRLPENDIQYDLNSSVSRKHAAIRFEGDVAFIEDVSRKTGVYVNHARVTSAPLHYGDTIYIMGLKIVYLGDFVAINHLLQSCSLPPYTPERYHEPKNKELEQKYFTRSPRIIKTLDKSEFEIDPPPEMYRREDMPLILTLGPSLTMAIAMFVSLGITISNATNGTSVGTSATMAVSMFIGALVWPVAIHRYQKGQENKRENHRFKKYKEYIYQKKLELEEKKQRNIKILTEFMYPAPSTIISFLNDDKTKRRLWEKAPNHEDFLEVRLGTGKRPFDVSIVTSKQGFKLYDDQLAEEPIHVAEEYRVLDHVPITVSLKEHKLIGFIGDRKNILNNANCIALNLAGQHSYDEVKMVFIYNEREGKHFEWVRELPHVWSKDHSLRYVATNKEEVHHLFSALNEEFREREEQLKENQNDKSIPLPKFVFFVADERLVENEPLMRYLTNPNNPVDVSSLFIYGHISMLPKDCDTLVQNDSVLCGIYFKNKFNNQLVEFQQDEVSLDSLNSFSQKISKLKIKMDGQSLDVPESVSLFGMLKIGNLNELNIEQIWNRKEPYKSLDVPIGIKAGGDMFSLDIHEKYHGPHGLVAGMTGSGKSEFLQTYIITAALNYHPDDLSFVLIDYKGGGMANIFDGIPHIAGKITNLSGSQLNRSLLSIEAEIKRRQYLFNQYGVNHVDKYQKLFKEGIAEKPLPHLVIIADEFAQLKSQQPDFMRKLIDVAQIGRSLGIHMILATQKPAGVVDDQIWGNSRFRVCLKVLDKQDSNEMLRKPDAALIKLPGRCYVQVGYDEIYEYVQSAYSGANYIPTNGFINENEQTVYFVDSTATTIRKAKKDLAGQNSDISQLEAVIERLIEMKKTHQIQSNPLWLEPLREVISLPELDGYREFNGQWYGKKGELSALIGFADFPTRQQQKNVEIDLINDGHVVIYGTSGTGKTTFLQTLLFSFASKYSPSLLNMYILDFSGRTLGYFAQMPHCEEVIYADEEEKLRLFLEEMTEIMEERKILFSENHVGTYESYLLYTKKDLPAILIVLDNYSIFKDQYIEYQDTLVNLVANGKTYGIFFVITGNSADAVNYRVEQHVSNVFALRMNDYHDYRDVLGAPIPIEPDNIRGRGLTIMEEVVEFQTALIAPIENEAERVSYIQQKIKEMSAAAGNSFKKEREKKAQANIHLTNKQRSSSEINTVSLPERNIKSNLKIIEPGEHTLYVGNLAAKNQALSIPLEELHSFYIGGLEKTGKTDYLKFLIKQIKEYSDRQIVLIDRPNKELEDFAKETMVNDYLSTAEAFDSYLNELEEIVEERWQTYNNLVQQGVAKEDIALQMQRFEKVFICINGFASFYDMMSEYAPDRFAPLTVKSKGLNIFYLTLENSKSVLDYGVTELYIHLIKTKHGMMMGGKIEKQKIFVFEEMEAKERKLELMNGQGFLFDGNAFGIVTNPSVEMEVKS